MESAGCVVWANPKLAVKKIHAINPVRTAPIRLPFIMSPLILK
jgi:hypothetical protein